MPLNLDNKGCYLLAWLLLSPGFVSATTAKPADLDEVVVSASRLPGSSPQTVESVLTRNDIDTRQPASLTELLRALPGVNVIEQGGRGGLASLVVRGGESNFTVVLIDGVRVNDPTNTRGGSFDFSSLDLAAIERVEIVRGPMSAVYGSDALAGLVNIVTRRGSGASESFLGAAVGSDHFARVSAGLYGATNTGFHYAITGNRVDDGEQIVGSAYDDAGLVVRVGRELEEAEWSLVARYQDLDSRSFPEDSGGERLAVLGQTGSLAAREWHVGATYRRELNAQWSWQLDYQVFDRSDRAISPGIAPGVFDGVPPNQSDNRFERQLSRLTIKRTPVNGWSGVAGVEYQHERGQSAGLIDFGVLIPTNFALSRTTRSGFAEIQFKRDAMSLSASIRRDTASAARAKTSHRMQIAIQPEASNTRLEINWAEAFKLPSFFALAHPLVGNSQLLPETARSWDIGVRHRFSGLPVTLGVTAFRAEYVNLIDFDPEQFTNVNRSRVESEGVEFSARYAFRDDVSIRGHLTYGNTRVLEEPTELRGRPLWRSGVSVEGRFSDSLSWNLQGLYNGDVFEASIPTGLIGLKGYWRLDANVRWQWRSNCVFALALDNLNGERYEEAVGFVAPRQRWRASVSYRF